MRPPRCMATMIGSTPFLDPQEAVRKVLATLPEAPICPELPKRSFWEGMVAAHTGMLPGLLFDEAARRVYIDTQADCAAELAAFYERVFAAEGSSDLSDFALLPRYASAIDPTADALRRSERRYPVVKVQCVGPISFSLELKDQDDRPLYFNETFQDVLCRQVALQSRWLARRFRDLAEEVVVFLDEPNLAAFGSSAYLGVLREDVIALLGNCIRAIQAEGAIAGVHVCGNTDWPMILESGADLLNFDAYDYGPSILVYTREIEAHVKRGGILAFGIVPNSGKIRSESVESLEQRFFRLVDELSARRGGTLRESILSQSMITPSCGLGLLSVEDADRVMRLLCDLSGRVQARVRK